MNKKLLSFLAIFTLILAVNSVQAKSNNQNPNSELPEQDGIYEVKNHKELKLRIFVHRAKPTPAPYLDLSCNLPDPDSSAVVPGAGWKLPTTMSWTYRLNLSSVPASVGSKNLSTIANNAYSVWKDAVSNKVNFTQGLSTSVNRAKRDGQNIIAWGRVSGSALAISYIWYNTSTGLAAEVDTIMNLKFPWAWSNPDNWETEPNTTCAYQGVYDAQDILTHELGHTMGLDDVYTQEYENATMFGYGSKGETKADTLTTGDKTGVNLLY